MQLWLENELSNVDGIADLISNIDDLENFTPINKYEKIVKNSFDHCIKHLYETTILSADKNISMNAGNIGLKSGTTLLMEAVTGGWKTSGDIVLKGRNIYLNTYDPELPLTNQPLEFYKQANVSYNTDKKLWEPSDETFESLSPYAPTHEPWTRQSGQLKKNDVYIHKFKKT